MSNCIIIWFILCNLATLLASPYGDELNPNGKSREDYFNTEANIRSHGYPAETHHVTTADGYVLRLHRIPHGASPRDPPSDPPRDPAGDPTRDPARDPAGDPPRRTPVLLMHGLTASSDGYIYLGPQHSIGYILADAGYDVWLGNARGNVHSRHHLALDPDGARRERRQFFDFSWQEIGMIDLPTMVDHVLNHTGSDRLHYIGHSQGGTSLLVMLSTRTEYNDKIASAHLLAGVGYKDHFPQPILRSLAQRSDTIYGVAVLLGVVEFLTPNFGANIPGLPTSEQCSSGFNSSDVCDLTEFIEAMNDSDLGRPQIYPAGAATKQFAHYGQNIRDKEFRMWNYGSRAANTEVYGTADPPIFNISTITVDTVMHYTISDSLLDERDAIAMAEVMPNTRARRVARDNFSHLDFIAAYDAKDLVTDYIVRNIKAVENRIEESQLQPGDSSAASATSSVLLTISFVLGLRI